MLYHISLTVSQENEACFPTYQRVCSGKIFIPRNIREIFAISCISKVARIKKGLFPLNIYFFFDLTLKQNYLCLSVRSKKKYVFDEKSSNVKVCFTYNLLCIILPHICV